jgi:ribonuclease R
VVPRSRLGLALRVERKRDKLVWSLAAGSDLAPMLSDSAILQKIGHQPKRSASFKQLVRELGLRSEQRRELDQRLERMVANGQILKVDSGRYALPAARKSNTVVGRLSMHRDGYGFVIPDPKTLEPRLETQLVGDIFIAPPFVGSAMHGDRVLVEIATIRPDGRTEGRIIRPVSRAHPTVVGKFHYGSRNNFVVPIDEKIRQEIVIPPGLEYPVPEAPSAPEPSRAARGKKQAHRVLGEEAARHTEVDNLEGMVVDVEITGWPSPTQNPRGKVVEILGYEDDFGVDVEIMIRKHHLPHRFPPAVLQEGQALENAIPSRELRKRRDYRDLPIVTIDGETARDFDDAVTVRRLESGNYQLQVHIADVANYVRDATELDAEARLRGTSVYFPDRAVPMLPLELSTDICSLRPHLDRLVLSCVIEIDHRGEILGYELNEGVIRSAERMTYTAVNAVLEGDQALRKRYGSLVSLFEQMSDLALILNRKRVRRGSIDFDLPEPVIEFDENGLMKSITRSERNIAHRLIEEFMLAANECVAAYLENKRVATLYRIHEKPEAKRVYEFEMIAATFGYSLGVGALPIQRVQLRADRRASRGTGRNLRAIEIPKEVHITPRMYQKLTEKIAGKPEEQILSYLMLRSLKQARYSEVNEGHFALAAPTYTHFTSPIRRYPDLIVHRILKEVLRSEPETWDREVPVGVSGSVSGRTRLDAGATGVPARRASGGVREEHDFSPADDDARRKAPEVARPGQTQHGDAPSPWSKRRVPDPHRQSVGPPSGPIPLDELHDIAEQSSQSERRADEAERELMEWKKVKFMQDRIGEVFDGLIISVTKFGFFVELTDLFVEGLVPLNTLTDDRYFYRETTREIIGQRTRKTFHLGQEVRVIVDRIDPVEKKIQLALFEEEQTRKKRTQRR